jgi:hypothetical protein
LNNFRVELSVESNNFRTTKLILVIYSSNEAALRTEFEPRGQKLKFAFWGVINKRLPQSEFPSKNTPLSNFLTTQPLHTNCNSIDAARQAKYDIKLKIVKISLQGSNFRENSPKGNFSVKNPNLLINFERMEIDENCQRTT